MNPPSDFKDRLSMIDSSGNRKFIIPAEVRGYFQKRKKIIHGILLLIFLLLPWIRLNGEQIILLDITKRQFHFFGLHLQSHDAPLIFFVLFSMTMALVLVTALFGRVWCGWACPQTVFIESVYRKIEIWVEGNYLARRKMREQPATLKTTFKVILKWILFFLVSFIFAHSFLAYWTGGVELLQMMGRSPQDNQFYFWLVMGMTAIILFNFGWFREQFCLIVCPYGRVQSVLLDSHSVTVMYDEKRGEPRKGKGVGGDCVSCQRCVQVCPTGIDIRNGVQMECIGCTACIDACDEIMEKIKKPKGLIRYKALTEKPIRWFRPRILAYSVALVFSLSGLVFMLSHVNGIRAELLRAHDNPYTVLTRDSQSIVQNHFILRLENHESQNRRFQISLNDQKRLNLILPENPITIESLEHKDIPLFIEVDQKEMTFDGIPVEVDIQILDSSKPVMKKNIQVIGPVVPAS
jgi:cytochrome c oxidase accessory protein FixG